MQTSAAAPGVIRTLRLDKAQVKALLNRLSRLETPPSDDCRGARRYAYNGVVAIAHMRQPGASSAVPFLVAVRNISETGLAFLHGGFVHCGTECLLQLLTADGAWNNVTASVVRCRHVEANIHEVGVHFEYEVDPLPYHQDPHAVPVPRVLVVSDDPTTAQLATFHLAQLQVRADATVPPAVADACECVLLDLSRQGAQGAASIEDLRRRGYAGLIVALTTESDPAGREQLLRAGGDRCLPHPFAREDLVDLLEWFQKGPLPSHYQADPVLAEALEVFRASLSARVCKLEEALAAGSYATLKAQAQHLKAVASSHGFPHIAATAARLEAALIDRTPLSQLRDVVADLVQLCLRARSAARWPVARLPA
jgi:DNA-binding response OmpR family regulator